MFTSAAWHIFMYKQKFCIFSDVPFRHDGWDSSQTEVNCSFIAEFYGTKISPIAFSLFRISVSFLQSSKSPLVLKGYGDKLITWCYSIIIIIEII